VERGDSMVRRTFHPSTEFIPHSVSIGRYHSPSRRRAILPLISSGGLFAPWLRSSVVLRLF
jgi:hypothetical protein